MNAYRQQKELFASNLNDTNLYETSSVIIILKVSQYLFYFIKTNLSIKSIQTNNKSYSRIIELFHGQILIATCICILSVDFSRYPTVFIGIFFNITFCEINWILFIKANIIYFQFNNYLILSNNLQQNFIDVNREGIFSLGEYVCLYFIGIYIGKFITNNKYKQKFKQMGIIVFILMIILCTISYNPSRK
ncbi:unnamed protein product [Rotaria sp. Silwood2]|nr:unnamed protein product [Rotaria sp. Silwood2]CAF4557828.1 unnamed protein product [Rotaria sp. Silwood2]